MLCRCYTLCLAPALYHSGRLRSGVRPGGLCLFSVWHWPIHCCDENKETLPIVHVSVPRKDKWVAVHVATRALRGSACMEQNKKYACNIHSYQHLSLSIFFDRMCGKHENVRGHLENEPCIF